MRRLLAVMLLFSLLVDACESPERERSSSAATPVGFCEAVERLIEVKLAPPVDIAVDSSMSDAEIDARVRQGREQLSTSMAEADEALAALERSAPAEIDAEVDVVVSADRAYVATVARTGFDVVAAASAGRIGDPEVAAAEGEIDAHARARCGVAFQRLASAGASAETTSVPPRPVVPTIRGPVPPPAPRGPAEEPAERPEAPVVDE